MLDKMTQCTEDILRVVLAKDFEDAMGILVAIGVHKNQDDTYVCRALENQSLLPERAAFLIGICFNNEQLRDADIHEGTEALANPKIESERKGGRRAIEDTSAILLEAEASQSRREIGEIRVFKCFNQNHCEEVLIRNGVG